MQIEISDELYERYRAFLKQRYLSEDVAAGIEGLITAELRRRCGAGYETDKLTGCKTRYQLEHDINRATWGDGNQDVSPFRGRYLCVDIDNFKHYLDIHGLTAGDKVLVALAEQLRRSYPGAGLYRIGGDEFVVDLEDRDVVPLQPIRDVVVKYSVVQVTARGDRQRLHHLNRTILFHLDEGIINASPAGTKLAVEYPRPSATRAGP